MENGGGSWPARRKPVEAAWATEVRWRQPGGGGNSEAARGWRLEASRGGDRSRYPTESPAKKAFPFEHLPNASSNWPIAASVSSTFSALSSSVAAHMMPTHAGKSCKTPRP